MAVYSYTTRLESVVSKLEDEFATVCEKRDFEHKLKDLKDSEGYSDYPSRLRELADLLDMIGISYEQEREYKYYEDLVRSCSLPDSMDAESRIMYSLYSIFKKFPDPEAYMLRLVDRLSLDEDGWGDESLRLRILKRFIKYANCMKYTKNSVGADGTAKNRTISIYGGEGYIKKYIKNSLGKKCATVEDMLENIDDGVFDALADASKEQKRASGVYGLLNMCNELATGSFKTGGVTKRALYMFAMAYDMTYFSGDTAHGEILDRRTDLEANLFQDYYNNNLTRFLTETYKGNLGQFDLDPSGQGINYKNFAEMVYLYYISRDMNPADKIKGSNEMINRLIERNKRGEAKSVLQKNNKKTVFYRGLFKIDDLDGLFVEDVLKLPENEFEDFIYNNYKIDAAGNTSPLEINSDQQTAYGLYLELLSRLIVEMKKQSGVSSPRDYSLAALSKEEQLAERSKWLRRCNYGLRFIDTRALNDNVKNSLYERLCSVGEKWPGIYDDFQNPDRDMFSDFLKLLSAADSCYIGSSPAAKSFPKALCAADPSEVSRTAIITAYYYYYNAVHELDDESEHNTFEKIYDNYCAGLNPILDAAHYQKLSSKNIFDILIVFSSYAMQNIG